MCSVAAYVLGTSLRLRSQPGLIPEPPQRHQCLWLYRPNAGHLVKQGNLVSTKLL